MTYIVKRVSFRLKKKFAFNGAPLEPWYGGRASKKTGTDSALLGSHVYNSLIAWFMILVCIIVIKLRTFLKL